MTFAEKLAQPGVVCGWGFDSTSKINTFGVTPDQAMSYWWDPGDAVCTAANPGGIGNGSRNYASSAGERICSAYSNEAAIPVCYFPVVDNSFYHTAGGGTGSVKFTVPTNSADGTGGYLWVPYLGMGTEFYIGPNHANGGIMYQQWYEYVDPNFISMLELGSTVLNNGAVKQTWIFGNPPGGNDSSTFEITPAIRVDGGTFECSGNQGLQPYVPDVFDCGSGLDQPGLGLQQGSPSCCYQSGNVYGDYPEPRCKVIHSGQWYEHTYRCEFRIVDTNFTVSGDHLIRASATFDAGQIADQRAVFIVGDTAMRRMVTLVSPNEVILESTPDAGVQGSGKSAYISFWPNTLVQSWVDGVLNINYGTASVFWGPNVLSVNGYGLGYGGLKFMVHMTNKDPSVAHPNAYRWQDDVIVSTEPIAFGSGPVGSSKLVMVTKS